MRLPRGFSFAGLSAGIKEDGKKDLALIVSEVPATATAVFTRNRVVAAPVILSRKILKKGRCQAVVINSGNANACTGYRGLEAAKEVQKRVARHLALDPSLVAVASTGKIGVPLPVPRVVRALPRLVQSLSIKNFQKAAVAILTTDRFAKVAFYEGKMGGQRYSIVGFAKGAGMIRPDMGPHATMLAFILTDLAVQPNLLKKAFLPVVDETFNRITVDGDTSTNDMALVLANGLSGGSLSGQRTIRHFKNGLLEVMQKLAIAMVRDGEGGTKVVKVTICGARNREEARKAAYAVAESELVKTSFYGQDPNWGRLLAAAGRSGATFDPSRADIYYDDLLVARKGSTTGPAFEKRARQVMRQNQFLVTLDLHAGSASFHVYSSDLTVDYVKLNAHYRT
ncbi:MAG: bifunctional glutamate N-acetyltransferase/amino-acid acetyltransferase ArgJ [Deltaproteobacteria bacterium]|nr:bifunctional glutamate N-acetyltransferase/amino-acid acetyltransferase ArgJ [Deltaproteobacteria bacterium]